MLKLLLRWVDNKSVPVNASSAIAWSRVIPFIIMHIACLLVIWVGVSKVAIATALLLYWGRIFAIGAFYHRYFSHRAFRTNRFWQFIFAVVGASAAQRGPIWWAAHHRQHHQVADTDQDAHSPITKSFRRSHMGWFLCHRYFHYDERRVRDWLKYPELCWLDRYDVIVPILLALLLFLLGEMLGYQYPHLHTSGLQLVVWGFFISTVAVFHSTFSINSLAHKFGRRRYPTRDHSRNNAWLALLTFGEGWHNNHHHFPISARQGFYWWEIDMTFYGLKLLEKMKIIHDIRGVPPHILK